MSKSSDLENLPTQPAGYSAFLLEIKTQIRQRQYQAMRAANSELLALYWWLGENISQRQLALGWGKSVVENLARDLQAEFPGRNGFSAPNLWLMRQFFNEYSQKPKLQPLVREISWAKNLVILARCKDDLELAVKDHYTFDFGGVAEQHSERELEEALVRNLRSFLAEMGGAFTFVGNQYRLEVDGKEYFIDLLLFHRRLRSWPNMPFAPCPDRWVSRPTLSPRNSPSATRTTYPARSRSPRGCKAGWAMTTMMKAEKLRS